MPEYIAYIRYRNNPAGAVHQLEAPNIRAARNTAATYPLRDDKPEEVRVIAVKDIPKVDHDN